MFSNLIPSLHAQVNMSNVLDVMPKEAFGVLYECLASKCNGGAKIAHWGMFDPNPCPKTLVDRGLLVPLSEWASSLFKEERVFFYSAFNLTEVLQK